MSRPLRGVLIVCAAGFLLAGCRQDMHNQPKYKPLRQSRLFSDQRASRQLPAGTVARGHIRADRIYYTGKPGVTQTAGGNLPTANASNNAVDSGSPGYQTPATLGSADPGYIKEFPMQVTRQVVERGKQRYEIFCTPCHGYTGAGNGMIVQRGFSPPPSFHQDRLRTAGVGYFFDVITNGYGSMYSYASRIPITDRWAIIAYIRALQMSQNMPASQIPADELTKLRAAASAPAGGEGAGSPVAAPGHGGAAEKGGEQPMQKGGRLKEQ